MTEQIPIKPGVSLGLPRQVRKAVEKQGKIQYTSAITVELISHTGGDWLVADSARVSTRHQPGVGPRDVPLDSPDAKLIKSLARNRHGAPFSHGAITFFVEAPLAIIAEWRTHQIWLYQNTDDAGYSQSSARYKPMRPIFWEPSPERKSMLPVTGFKAMTPDLYPAAEWEQEAIIDDLRTAYAFAWASYQGLLELGVAPEVARMVLPQGIYASMYATGNLRSWLNFCSLRVHEPSAARVSYPQAEIQEAAKLIEETLSELWPVSYQAWLDTGRNSL